VGIYDLLGCLFLYFGLGRFFPFWFLLLGRLFALHLFFGRLFCDEYALLKRYFGRFSDGSFLFYIGLIVEH
jgi:hypothetical protein